MAKFAAAFNKIWPGLNPAVPDYPDMQIGKSEPQGSHVLHELTKEGLHLLVERATDTLALPPSASVYYILPFVPPANAKMKAEIKFDLPHGSLTTSPPDVTGFRQGKWAVGLTFKTGNANEIETDADTERAGVTCQFRETGARLNFPSAQETLDESDIDNKAYEAYAASKAPTQFELYASIDRSHKPGADAVGQAQLRIGNHQTPIITFHYSAFPCGDSSKNISAVGVGVTIFGQAHGFARARMRAFSFELLP